MEIKFKSTVEGEDIILKSDKNNYMIQEWFYSDEALDEEGNPKYSKRASTERFPATLEQALLLIMQFSIKSADAENLRELRGVVKTVEKNILEGIEGCK